MAELMAELNMFRYFEEQIPIHLSRMEIITVIGNIILSLKHPSNDGPSTRYARLAAKKLIEPVKDDPEILAAVRGEWKEFFSGNGLG